MRIRQSLGMLLLAGGLTLLAACGDDNDEEFGATPTATRVPPTPQPTNTSAPPTATRTAGPTNTPGTPSPTSAPASPSPTRMIGTGFCGDGEVNATGEECDCGAVCVNGDVNRIGQTCFDDEECGTNGDCRPVGGQPLAPAGSPQPGACEQGSGAQPCAANCTFEMTLPARFANTCTQGTIGADCEPELANQCGQTCAVGMCGCNGGTVSRVQLTIAPLFLPIQGTQTFRAGTPRDEDTIGPSQKVLYRAGQLPVAIRATDFAFEQISVTGLACACVRAFPQAEFGPGLAGVGVIECGADGGSGGASEVLSDINYLQNVDHNAGVISQEACRALPGQGTGRTSGVEMGGANGATCMGSPVGECQANSSVENGVTWEAGDSCNMQTQCNDPHPTICNYLEQPPTFSGGSGTQGSALIRTFTAISAIGDGGLCATNCQIFENGADCIPCTDDDRRQQEPNTTFTTTGTAEATLRNANPSMTMPTVPTGISISTGSLAACTNDASCTTRGERCYRADNPAQLCGGTAGCQCRTACGALGACITSITGGNFDCATLRENPAVGLTTGNTVISFGSLHAAQGLDLVATTRFQFEPNTTAAEEP